MNFQGAHPLSLFCLGVPGHHLAPSKHAPKNGHEARVLKSNQLKLTAAVRLAGACGGVQEVAGS